MSEASESAPPSGLPRVLKRSDHPVSRKNISENALKVLYRLHGAGFKAFLVGGSVRDMMLGREPKDFDVATDARPNEVRRLFRNSRLIGRRFRLVHVFFKEGVVEVSTFRREPDPNEQEVAEGELLITSDNSFGTPEQDAFRRDFTINALFYNIEDFTVIDYVGGTDDLALRSVRVIGDPDVRFREDPVRMMRACEFAARLGFGIEPGTQEAIGRQCKELAKASAARLTEEIVQLLRSGHAGPAVQCMLELGLLEDALPELLAIVTGRNRGFGDFSQLLPTLDGLAREGAALSDVTLLAAVLLPAVLVRRFEIESERARPMTRRGAELLTVDVVEPFAQRLALSRARRDGVAAALLLFQEFAAGPREPHERARLMRRAPFAEALALLEILVRATGEGGELLEVWRREWLALVAKRNLEAPRVDAEAVATEPAERGARGGRPPVRRRRRRKA